jgi:bifunctional ADP-heptose synthase (sugar kinase/adenylyltransferase)
LSDLPEAELVAAWGGRTVIVARADGHSSSAVIERIRAARHFDVA